MRYPSLYLILAYPILAKKPADTLTMSFLKTPRTGLPGGDGSPHSEMPFIEHLAELRTRIMHAAIGVLIGTSLSYFWVESLFAMLTEPIRGSFTNLELIGTGPADAFVCKLKIGVAAGILLSCPWIFYQLWLFVAPGLHETERRFAAPFVAFSSSFFLAGCAFCFYLVLPVAFRYFSDEFVSVGVRPSIRIEEYLPFVVKMCLVFGGVFELPIGCYFLARMGLITHAGMIKNFRYAVVVIFIVAAILTPPDVVSQCMLAGPLLVIYGLCIWITAVVGKKPVASTGDKPA